MLRKRMADDCALARTLNKWSDELERHWPSLHIGHPAIARSDEHWRFSVPVSLGEVSPDAVQVELFADEKEGQSAEVVILHRERAIPGTLNGYLYGGEVALARPAQDYTVRVVPHHEEAHVPLEMPLIAWQR